LAAVFQNAEVGPRGLQAISSGPPSLPLTRWWLPRGVEYIFWSCVLAVHFQSRSCIVLDRGDVGRNRAISLLWQ
jgi:hypothetical protein